VKSSVIVCLGHERVDLPADRTGDRVGERGRVVAMRRGLGGVGSRNNGGGPISTAPIAKREGRKRMVMKDNHEDNFEVLDGTFSFKKIFSFETY
jgi:hypothetical protein